VPFELAVYLSDAIPLTVLIKKRGGGGGGGRLKGKKKC